VADNLLTTTALATQAPLLIAPAMNVHMWRDETTQHSLACLRERGAIIIEPEAGYLACGEVGEGRLASIEEIAQLVGAECVRAHELTNRRILVTAGPTREYLDPVRYFSNPSSGTTGYAIAEEAARRGATVTLVSGPTTLPDPFGCSVIRVTSALEMFAACERAFGGVAPANAGVTDSSSSPDTPANAHAPGTPKSTSIALDAAIFTAAVADYRPAKRANQKLKKGELGDTLSADLVANPDIFATLAADKGTTTIVGFAAETRDVIAAAQHKLVTKNADLIVANDVSSSTLGFASTHNRWHFVTAQGVETTDVLHKRILARLLLDTLSRML
jgi:phosphopantothenoylcysteine decarboxylase/phosphopantothenate--cysteine ligase